MNVRQDWWKQYRKYIIGVVTGVSVFLTVKYLLPLIMPFFLALCIVSFLHPRLRKLEERFGIRKNILAWILLLLAGALLAGLLWYCMTFLCTQIGALTRNLDCYEDIFCGFVHSCCQGVEKKMGINADAMETQIFFHVDRLTETLKESALPKLMNESVSYMKWICSACAFFAVTFIATLLLAKDFAKIHLQLSKYRWFAAVREVGGSIAAMVGGYLKAQGIILCIISGVCVAGLFAAGITRPILLGILAGALDALPFIGTGIVLVPTALWQLVQGKIWQSVIILALYGGCILIREVLEPRLLGRRTDSYPVVILLAIYMGVKLYGVAGVVFGPFSFLLIREIYRKTADFCEND